MPRVLRSSVYVERPGAEGAQLLAAGTTEESIKSDAPYALRQLGDHVWVDVEEQPAEEFQAVGEVSRVQLLEAQNRANQLEEDNGRLRAEVEQLTSENADLRQQLEAAQVAPPADDEPSGEPTQDDQETPNGPQGDGGEGSGSDPLPENVDKLKKDELKALAAERGIEVGSDDTNAQIVEKLKASEQ